MNKIPNRQIICEVLMQQAETDKDIVVVCSDSRGSASLAPFAEKFPQQFVEVGIAEQNLVSVSAGLATCGKKVFAASPACFLSTRSYEQAKVDVAYSKTNVKLIGISGGVSYGALGMTHHSAQDIAAMSAIPDMRVYLPSDRLLTAKLITELLKDNKPAYIRVGRNAVEDVYEEKSVPFELNKSNMICNGKDLTLIGTGETVFECKKAAEILSRSGLTVRVLDMYCVKPIDEEAVIKAAKETNFIVTVEEHSPFGGLGAQVAQIVSRTYPKKVLSITLPDSPVITGTGKQVFEHYGLVASGITAKVWEYLK